MASSRTGRWLPYSLRVVQWRRNDRCTARELVNRKDGRLPDDADLVVRALALLEGFAAYPVAPHTTAERLPAARYSTSSLHLGSCPTHRERRATWAGRPGRLVTGEPQPKPYSASRAACHRTAAGARRRSRAAACRAIARRPTKTSLVSRSFKRSPRSISIAGEHRQYRRKSLIARDYLAIAGNPFSFCNNICHERTHALQQTPASFDYFVGPDKRCGLEPHAELGGYLLV